MANSMLDSQSLERPNPSIAPVSRSQPAVTTPTTTKTFSPGGQASQAAPGSVLVQRKLRDEVTWKTLRRWFVENQIGEFAPIFIPIAPPPWLAFSLAGFLHVLLTRFLSCTSIV